MKLLKQYVWFDKEMDNTLVLCIDPLQWSYVEWIIVEIKREFK